MISAVLIDVDDTLLDFEKCAEYSMAQALGDIGQEMKKGYFDTFTEQNNLLWKRIEKGEITVSELYKIRWNIILEKLNIDYDGVKFEELFLRYLEKSAVPVTGANEMLAYLHSKYKVYVASNAPYRQQQDRLSLAEMTQYLDGMFISEEIGVSKPDKRFFDYCMKELNIENPQEIMLVGDSLSSDIAGGINSSMKTCWLNRHGKTAPDGKKIDYIITDLREIKEIL